MQEVNDGSMMILAFQFRHKPLKQRPVFIFRFFRVFASHIWQTQIYLWFEILLILTGWHCPATMIKCEPKGFKRK